MIKLKEGDYVDLTDVSELMFNALIAIAKMQGLGASSDGDILYVFGDEGNPYAKKQLTINEWLFSGAPDDATHLLLPSKYLASRCNNLKGDFKYSELKDGFYLDIKANKNKSSNNDWFTSLATGDYDWLIVAERENHPSRGSYVDKPPIYTQKMKDAGELPVVGMAVMVGSTQAVIHHYSEISGFYVLFDDGSACIYHSMNLKPIETRTND